MTTRKTKPVEIASDVKVARLLVDPIKRQILRHLAEKELTQKMLGELLGMADPSVYYHLKALTAAQLIRVVRREPEAHGIVQKFYAANALYFIADYGRMPLDLRSYFIAVNLERLRGVFAILRALRGIQISLSSAEMEKLADRLAYSLVEVAKEEEKRMKKAYQDAEERESFIINLYGDALRRVIEKDPDSIPVLYSQLSTLGLLATRRDSQN